MRIDRLHIENFKKFKKLDFDLHPQFTLLVGDNGSGKTTILDALAVAAGIWLVAPPDSSLSNSGRNILPSEVRLEPEVRGDRIQFSQEPRVFVRAVGKIGDHENVEWIREMRADGRRSNQGAKAALAYIKSIYSRDKGGERFPCPVLAYYGAGRAWLPSNERNPNEATPGLTLPFTLPAVLPERPGTNGPARRWGAFYDCFSERIRFAELQNWFLGETVAAGNRGGRMRPGFEVVKRALLCCVPDADNVWYDHDRRQIVFSISANPQPFDNLSAGQRMMLALVADLAIKAVTQNAFLVPPDEPDPDDVLPRVLRETPGLVLIDELDVHLHPKWQRRVATDLKSTFPGIQFVCTSHSPQVIGEVARDEVRLLTSSGTQRPSVARGADSNWILDHVMEGMSSDASARDLQDKAEDAMAEGDLRAANDRLRDLRRLLDGDTGELVRLEGSLHSLEALTREPVNEE